MSFEDLVTGIGRAVEVVGVAAILIGGVIATVRFGMSVRGSRGEDAYRIYRRDLGRGLLLGLEFLVAGDIIRTVTASPSLYDVGVLGGIVLIRTFLSVALELETEGRWPWQLRQARDGRRNDG